MKIDSHHHFWLYDPIEYDWIDHEMAAIRRNFLASDLYQTLSANNIDGAISVQARQSLLETTWLLDIAAENDFIKGVVGWVDLRSQNCAAQLESLCNHPKFKGVRHVIQGEPDPEFILEKNFNHGIDLLERHNLSYDILIFEHQLVNTIKFVDKHPNTRFIVDHIAKPQIKKNHIEPWKTGINELAKRENVCCKLSGMVTEADYSNWTLLQLRPYAETVLEAFGSKRVLFGSDWPVCLVAASYHQWLNTVESLTEELSEQEKKLIMGDNACCWYNIAD